MVSEQTISQMKSNDFEIKMKLVRPIVIIITSELASEDFCLVMPLKNYMLNVLKINRLIT